MPDTVKEPLTVGEHLVTICEVELSEDEKWAEGIDVYVAQTSPCNNAAAGFGPWNYELEADDGSIGSFNSIDIFGPRPWFRYETNGVNSIMKK